MRVDKLNMSWYQQWETGSSFAVCRGLKSVTCCMSKQSTWKSKWKVCWGSRKPEKSWLQSREKLQSIFDFTKKNEREQKTFQNTKFWALFFNRELSTEMLESCNMWCVHHIENTGIHALNSFTAVILFLSRTNTVTTKRNKIVKIICWHKKWSCYLMASTEFQKCKLPSANTSLSFQAQ